MGESVSNINKYIGFKHIYAQRTIFITTFHRKHRGRDLLLRILDRNNIIFYFRPYKYSFTHQLRIEKMLFYMKILIALSPAIYI